jgi:hypothetical protein
MINATPKLQSKLLILLWEKNIMDSHWTLPSPAFELSRSCLLLLENNCIDRDSNTNANSSKHGEGRLKLLVLHPVQVVHVLGMDVVWFSMCMSSHPPYTSGMESTRS